jgi:adenylate cyclase
MIWRWNPIRDILGGQQALTQDISPTARGRASLGRLLLVDDSPLVRDAIGRRLESSGWEVRRAGGGKEALALVRAWPPDTVVCDLHMPDMAGLDVLHELQRIDRTLPVVVLSGDHDLEAVLSAVRLGAFDYVLKRSDELETLDTAIARAVAHGRLARENVRLTEALERANRELEARVQELHEQHEMLEQSRARSDALLRNILPGPVAERLMHQEQVIADGFDQCTVLFADIVGFTRLAAGRSPIAVVKLLDEIVSGFDRLVERHGLEKIKTMGDAYMAAAGLPTPRADHAQIAAEMALDMLDVIAGVRVQGESSLDARIGLHSGPVVAGVIGTKKFSYDVWGDTVNLASRMESSSMAGRIQISEATYRLLGDHYVMEARGPVAVKGKGAVSTWFLVGRAGGGGG